MVDGLMGCWIDGGWKDRLDGGWEGLEEGKGAVRMDAEGEAIGRGGKGDGMGKDDVVGV